MTGEQLTRRSAAAQQRITEATTVLAERLGLTDEAAAFHREPKAPDAAHRRLFDQERTADLLDAIVQKMEA